MQLIERAEAIHRAIQNKIDAMQRAIAISEWRFCIGAPEGAQAPDYDDRDWQLVRLMRTWSSADGEAWFRLKPALPAEVEGIDLAGTDVELDIFLTIGAAVYVNGELRFREPSWSDTRAIPLPLTRHYRPGEPLTLVVRCNAGDGFGLFLSAGLRFGRLADAIFELDVARSQFAFTRFLAEAGADRADKAAAWQRAADALDLGALDRNDWPAWRASLEAARAELAPFAAEAKTYTANLIAHSHIDMNWLWPWQETIDVCRRDFTSVDKLMSAYPEFVFSQSQAAVYQAIEQRQPDLFARVRERVREGRWDVTASTWVEGDLNMACGEALVRQLLHTRRYIGDRFGIEPPICWEPDTFGHIATLPQILRKSGVRYYYFCRAGRRYPLFWWEGLDGSRVLALQDLRGYGGENRPSDIVGSVLDFAAPCGIHNSLYVYGVGDHGGGATARDIEAARRIDALPYLPRARPGSTVAFYEKALEESPALPVVRGELNTVFEGCYTSHADIKRLNRDGENSLLTAESLATLATAMTGQPYPLAELAEAWRALCFHQFHDILCGCAIGVTYREARERFADIARVTQQARRDALNALAAAVNTAGQAGEGRRIVVFNPLGWECDAVVQVALAELDGEAPQALMDDAGRLTPAQTGSDMAGNAVALFVAEKLPALGARVYRPVALTEAQQAMLEAEGAARADADSNTLENGLVRLRVNPASGAIDQLIDLASGRDLAGPWAGWGPEARVNAGMLNRMQILWEQPHPMSAWNIGDITRVDHLITGAEARVVEQGPVRAVIEVQRKFLNSSLRQRICLCRRLRRIDFETQVDWRERGSAHHDAPMLRVTFSPALGDSRATFEIAFAGLERTADGREVPALRWADLSELEAPSAPSTGGGPFGLSSRHETVPQTGYGLALLNDGKHGHQAHGNTLGLTLLRASYEPDNNPDEGLHQFTYALYPHAETWREAGIIQRAAELNQPAAVVVTDAHTGRLEPGRAWLACESPSVLVSAVKLAEDQPEHGAAIIIRLYEAHGRAAEATLKPAWPVARAEETDMIERPLSGVDVIRSADGDQIRLAFAPHEIRTLRLSMA